MSLAGAQERKSHRKYQGQLCESLEFQVEEGADIRIDGHCPISHTTQRVPLPHARGGGRTS